MPPNTGPRSDADGVIGLMQKATEANLNTPDRIGLLLDFPPQGEVLYAGDLHGNGGNFRRLIDLADLPRFPRRRMIVHEVVHQLFGYEPDRSYRLVEDCARMKTLFPDQFHYLIGNHEFAEVTGAEIGKQGRPMGISFAEGLEEVYGPRWEEVKQAYCCFWRSCPFAVRTQNRLFLGHSTPRLSNLDELSLEMLRRTTAEEAFTRDGAISAMLWGRDYRPETADTFAARMEVDLLIVGHTPCEEGILTPNHRHVVLDSTRADGCYVLLPLDRSLTQADVLARVRQLFG